jgi:NitT/TauT family transport system permease protein
MSRTNSKHRNILMWQLALAVAFIATWEWGSATKMLDPFFFSRPSQVIVRVAHWITTGSIWPHILTTFTEAALSFALGAFLGVVFGFLLARVPILASILDPYIRIANSLPRVVLAPIFLLWFD